MPAPSSRSSWPVRCRPLAAAALILLLRAVAPAAGAWTPASQRQIAATAARLAPPDFYRQLARNRAAYLQGATDPFDNHEPELHFANPDGGGRLDEAIARAVEHAVAAIRAHRPFNEVSYRAGVAAHYVADANNPLLGAEADPVEARYRVDFRGYLESVEPRVEIVFYGFRPAFDGSGDLAELVDETLRRSRGIYPLVGREYRRVHFAPGREAFDDRSTAYAVAALAYSHAISDIAEVLRYIWLTAGGADTRPRVPVRGRQVVHLPRASDR